MCKQFLPRSGSVVLSGTLPGVPDPAGPGYDIAKFAGRYAVGKNLATVTTKQGLIFHRSDHGAIKVLGGACSECLGGVNLAWVLKDGFEKEVRAMASLKRGAPAETLSTHTSAGVPQELDDFLRELAPHVAALSPDGDWCVNLQAEGASAALAAIDMVLQAQQPGADFSHPGARNRVACAASSYHGPASTSPGGAAPLGALAKGLTHPVRYPVPSPFLRHRGEVDADFHARMLREFGAYLDAHAHEIGVVMFEPQWGSSLAALPWPPALLRQYVAAARARGLGIVADEIMCGLGRHGAEPAPGGTGMFLCECWGVRPDCITFGKAIGGGAGHLLSGAVLLSGASVLRRHARTAHQSHTYAASSARALANGAALLRGLPAWRPHVRAIGDALAPVVAALNARAGGAVLAHGHGAMWGGLFAHADPAERRRAALDFKQRCADARLLPYFVPTGGFMLTPRYDDPPAELAAAAEEMAECMLQTVEAMGWDAKDLLPLEAEPTPPTPAALRLPPAAHKYARWAAPHAPLAAAFALGLAVAAVGLRRK